MISYYYILQLHCNNEPNEFDYLFMTTESWKIRHEFNRQVKSYLSEGGKMLKFKECKYNREKNAEEGFFSIKNKDGSIISGRIIYLEFN